MKGKYLSKINMEMRLCILSKVWPLDGEGKPPRKPDTWEEVAECVELELESRADAKAPQTPVDTLKPLEDAAQGEAAANQKCRYCKRTGHQTAICPRRASDVRGETALAVADFKRHGTKCGVCGYGDHKDVHHHYGTMDAGYTMNAAGQVAWKSVVIG